MGLDRHDPDASLAAIILAAGKGTRMRSDLPKVLHPIGARPMLHHVMGLAAGLAGGPRIVVVGAGAEAVSEAARAFDPAAALVVQEPQLGTGHAVQGAFEALGDFAGHVVVLYADTPLIPAGTLAELYAAARQHGAGVAVLGFEEPLPHAYGRLIVSRDEAGRQAGGERGAVLPLERIVEAKDCSPEEAAVELSNSGVMLFEAGFARAALPKLTNDNAKGEYYLTDLVALARAEGLGAVAIKTDADDVRGVNSRADLAVVEGIFQARRRSAALEGGVTLEDPQSTYFSADTDLGRDVTVGPHVYFGPGVRVGDGVRVRPFCHLEGVTVGRGSTVGPFARLRPGADLGEGVHVGNFVEIKNAVLGAGAKVNHLTYIGDADVGPRTNIGAGTITCNYDGFLKHRTMIGPDVFVGSNTALVAPVALGEGANIGAGSTITKDVPAGALSVTRAEQKTLAGWAKRFRARKQAEKDAKKKG
ncbi:MAG: bifunctional UDP-N-acetylglucosamine diphosphorylase/glucosamine-1-phosphate N-acetyltransferase GlmU [Pseudomonadota bacterium]